MSIEQYFGGRIRYIQVGDNGDSQPGVGCYAKSPGISAQDIAEIRKRYRQYLSLEENCKGKKPTIYKRVVFPTGSIVMTACSYIPSPQGSNGPIDRPDWIDHSYLVRGDDPAVLDPEKWIGLPYRTDDPNPVWEVVPDAIIDRVRNGEVYRTDKWIIAESLTNFPKSEFRLLPLTDVMKMWQLERDEMVDLIEAVMDCVAAPDQSLRKLFIKYDIDARDCLNSEYWNHSVIDEEQFNRYRMDQLLAWIYHLIPFSFRRRLGYDTMLDANAGYHHIIFVTESKIRSMGSGQIGYVFPSFDGTVLMDNRNTMMTGGGYLYDPTRGIWHDAEAGNRGYRELYRKDGIIQKLINEEVSAYTSARSMEEIRHLIKEYYHFFEQLETHIPIFSNSIAELESEIPRWKATLVADPEELKGMAITLLNRTGKEDISQNKDNYDYFRTVTAALKLRITDENRETIWLPVIETTVTRAPFKDQISFVGELSSVILANKDPLGKFEQYRKDERFGGVSIDNASLIGRVFCGLAGNEQFRNAWLASQYRNAKDYTSRLGAYESVNKQIFSMMGEMPERGSLCSLNDTYYKSLSLLTDTGNVKSLLKLSIGNAKTAEMAAYTARELEKNCKKLDIYKEVAEKGPSAFTEFRNSVNDSKMEAAAEIVSHLLQVVYDEWLSKFTAKRMPPADINRAASLLIEHPADRRFKDWCNRLIQMIDTESNNRNPYDGLTVDEFNDYLNALTETDPYMIKTVCRCYLFGHASDAIKSGKVIVGKNDLSTLSEYLTWEKNDKKYLSDSQNHWVESKIRKGMETLIGILTAQVQTEGSYVCAARLFENLSDENILNCNETKNALLNASRKYIDVISNSGKATEEDIRTFEKAFRWWESEPEVRAERRKIVRASNYKPTFRDIRNAVERLSRQAFEKLSDDGFIYDCERYNLISFDSVIKTMARQPEGMSITEWIGYYCDWTGEAFRTQDLGKAPSDYYLLDVMCEAILRDGVEDITPQAQVNYEWMKSLPTNNVKTDKLEKRGIQANNLVTLIIVKEVCEQLCSPWAKNVDASDREANKVVTKMIENGKVHIRYNDKTIDALCAYLKADRTLFPHMLYEWRTDRIVRVIETARKQADEQELQYWQKSFNRHTSQLDQIYTDEEMDLIWKALGMEVAVRPARTASGPETREPQRDQRGKNAGKDKSKKRKK